MAFSVSLQYAETINSNILNNYNGTPFTVTLKEIPELSLRTQEVLGGLDLSAAISHPPANLSRKIQLYYCNRRDLERSDVFLGLIKSVGSVMLLTVAILSFWYLTVSTGVILSPVAAFLVCASAMGSSLGLCAHSILIWFYTINTLNELRSQEAALGSNKEINCLPIVLCHLLIPFFSLIETVYHKQRWENIAQIKQGVIARDIADQLEYYTAHFDDLSKAITNATQKEQNATSINALEQAQKELRATHAFYNRTMEQTRKKIAAKIDSAQILPEVLGSIIAGYT